jgi:hypothetical protein
MERAPRRERDHIRAAIVLAAATRAAAALAVPPEPVEEAIAVRGLSSALMRRGFREAALEAGRRLRDPRCQAVFGDFSDEAGTPLSEVLTRREATPEMWFRRILFYDGSRMDLCSAAGTLAGAMPGTPVVFVCSRFARLAIRDVSYGADILIHEALHTLGLRENPPSSARITARTRARCDPRSREPGVTSGRLRIGAPLMKGPP